MDDVEQTKQIKSRMLPRISAEAALILFIALFGTLFVHLGFIYISTYHDAMGFPPALFPTDLVLLQILGFLSGVPVIALVALTPFIGFVGWGIGRTHSFKMKIVDPVKKYDQKLKLSIIILGALIAALIAVGWRYVSSPSVKFVFYATVIFICSALIPNVPPGKAKVKVGLIRIAVWLILCIVLFYLYVYALKVDAALAERFGQQDVDAIKEPQFSTVVPVEGESYKPGKLIVCSERFCGFHNGRKPKILSLDGIREIVPP